MNTKKKYPNKLQRYRRLAGYSPKQVTRMLNVKSESSIHRWERGLTMPSGMNLLRMMSLYDVELSDLYPEYLEKIKNRVNERAERFNVYLPPEPPIDRPNDKYK